MIPPLTDLILIRAKKAGGKRLVRVVNQLVEAGREFPVEEYDAWKFPGIGSATLKKLREIGATKGRVVFGRVV